MQRLVSRRLGPQAGLKGWSATRVDGWPEGSAEGIEPSMSWELNPQAKLEGSFEAKAEDKLNGGTEGTNQPEKVGGCVRTQGPRVIRRRESRAGRTAARKDAAPDESRKVGLKAEPES